MILKSSKTASRRPSNILPPNRICHSRLGILIDSSGSQARVLDMEKQVGGDFLSQILRDKDLAFVIDFDVNVELLQDFTSSVRLLKTALNSARINTAGGGGTGIPGLGGGPIPTQGAPQGHAAL